ncbi:cytochrome c-type protein NapC [Rhodobium orientis]|uniref:Cytochrome c-type protein n=1 Tax=Rhodobium orientis TaxID=34017 RepID=A0A327JLF2_9HYPH|nr:NapC/NirT family cytochrome c [Rhodobium orientis]MBB4301991.1 cytochrome c-type protein NapC [Rhodobium orientis]MBK5950228.1 Denitrification system component NirT [Rhodobium orientis]RAI27169.1 Denitrification system component NirT [Rhodobium orientis]
MNERDTREPGVFGRMWRRFWRPSRSWGFGAILILGIAAGVVLWGGFNWAVELTNTETFCISCHEMRDNVYEEYTETVHYYNSSGVRAVCTDCHVPKDWIHKMVRKVQASNELYHKVIGSIDTREKFQAKRLELASHVWRTMKETNSRECRNCHDDVSMDFGAQESRSADRHEEGFDEGKTCIDCHRGIAHQLPDGANEAYEKIAAEIGPTKKDD